MQIFATIKIELTRAGLYASCEELDEEIFIPKQENGSLEPLVKLINDAEIYCNPDTCFAITEKGMQEPSGQCQPES